MVSTSSLPKQSISKTTIRTTGDIVAAFLKSCERRNLSFDTIRSYKSFLLAFTKQYPELPTKPEPLEDYIGSFISSDERRHGAYRVLRVFYNFAEDRFGLPNPVKKIKAPRRKVKEKRALTIDEIKKLIEYPGHKPDIRALLYFLADTGARIGEATNLTSDDVYENTVRVSGKTGARIIPISEEVRQMFLSLGEGKLFKYTVYRLRRLVSKAFKDAGLPGFTAHSLRHSLATNWRGSDLALKYIGGWHSWAMVEHYSHRRLERALEEHRQHSPLVEINGNGKTKESNIEDLLVSLAHDIADIRGSIKRLEGSVS